MKNTVINVFLIIAGTLLFISCSDTATEPNDIVDLDSTLVPAALIEGRLSDYPGPEMLLNGDTPKFLIRNDEYDHYIILNLSMPETSPEELQVHWSTTPTTPLEQPDYWAGTEMIWWPPTEPGTVTFEWEITDGVETGYSSMDVEVVDNDEFDTYVQRAPGYSVKLASDWGDVTRFVSYMSSNSVDYYMTRHLNSAGGIELKTLSSGYAGEVSIPTQYSRLNSTYSFTKSISYSTGYYNASVILYSGIGNQVANRTITNEISVNISLTPDADETFFLLSSEADLYLGPDLLTIESVNTSLETIWATELPGEDYIKWPMWAHRLPDNRVLVECSNANGGLFYSWLDSEGIFTDSISFTGRSTLSRTCILANGTIVGLCEGVLVGMDSETLETVWSHGLDLSLYRKTSEEELVICTPSSNGGVDITHLDVDGNVTKSITILEDFDTFETIPGFDVTDNGYYIIGANSATRENVGWFIRTDEYGNVDSDNFLYTNMYQL